jgi:hypothetical protein
VTAREHLSQSSDRSGAAEETTGPILDEDGLLRYARRWEVIPDRQLRVVELLIRHANHLVPTELLATTHAQSGGSVRPSTISSLRTRLVHRFANVGLELRTVRGRGVILRVPPQG